MSNRTLTVTVIGLIILPMALYGQSPRAEGFLCPQEGRFPDGDRRLEAAAEYLELTDGQQLEWEDTLDAHRQTVSQEWQDLAVLREQFRNLAETNDPDLAELGSLALTMHRRAEEMRGSRSDLNDQLASILTPDQSEKFEALKAARETVRPRGKRERPHRGARPDSGGGGS
jgi:Spy/CpxP family protein refolding chaperone